MNEELEKKEAGNTAEPQVPATEQNQIPAEAAKIEISNPNATLEELGTNLAATKQAIIAQQTAALGEQPANTVTPPAVTEVKSETEGKTEGTEQTPPAEPKTDEPTPPANTEGEKLFKADSVKINEDYIATRPEDERVILQSLKGKRESVDIDQKFLKNYVNAQKHIETLRKEREDLLQGRNQDWSDVQPKEEEKDLIHSIAVQNLKTIYPDIPETEQGIKDYLRDLNVDDPESARNFLEAKIKVTQSAESQVKQAVYYKEHEDELAAQNIKAGQEMFASVAEMFGITNAKEFIAKQGLDFSDPTNPEHQKVLREIVWKKNPLVGPPITKIGGNGNPNDFSDKNATYIVNPQQLALKAFLESMPMMVSERMAQVEREAFEKGLNSRAKKEELNTPSISGSSVGTTSVKAPALGTIIDPNDDLGVMNQKYDALKEKIKRELVNN